MRSTLFMNISVGMRSRASASNTISVWACTPSAADTTSIAASSAHSERSTSKLKSAWPGVSISVTCRPAWLNAIAAARTDMPRVRSIGRVSVCAVPLSTLPSVRIACAWYSMRSVSVVLPASTCANMPRLSMARFSCICASE